MSIVNRAETQRRARMKQVKQNGIEHDERMTAVAARGGLTLEQMRALPGVAKDEFIFKYRDGGPNDK